jgi:hypothetical protein
MLAISKSLLVGLGVPGRSGISPLPPTPYPGETGGADGEIQLTDQSDAADSASTDPGCHGGGDVRLRSGSEVEADEQLRILADAGELCASQEDLVWNWNRCHENGR